MATAPPPKKKRQLTGNISTDSSTAQYTGGVGSSNVSQTSSGGGGGSRENTVAVNPFTYEPDPNSTFRVPESQVKTPRQTVVADVSSYGSGQGITNNDPTKRTQTIGANSGSRFVTDNKKTGFTSSLVTEIRQGGRGQNGFVIATNKPVVNVNENLAKKILNDSKKESSAQETRKGFVDKKVILNVQQKNNTAPPQSIDFLYSRPKSKGETNVSRNNSVNILGFNNNGNTILPKKDLSKEKTGFEKRVEGIEERRKRFEQTQFFDFTNKATDVIYSGAKNLFGKRNIIAPTLQNNLLLNTGSFSEGSGSEKVTKNVIKGSFLLGPGMIMIGENVAAVGEGLIKNPKGTARELFVNAPKRLERTSFSFLPGGTPVTEEGATTAVMIAGGGLLSRKALKSSSPIQVETTRLIVKGEPEILLNDIGALNVKTNYKNKPLLSASEIVVESGTKTVKSTTIGLDLGSRGTPIITKVGDQFLLFDKPLSNKIPLTDLKANVNQPLTASSGKVLRNQLLDLSPSQKTRVESAIIASRNLGTERGLPVKDFLLNIEGLRNPKATTDLFQTFIKENKNSAKVFGSLVTKQLPSNSKIGSVSQAVKLDILQAKNVLFEGQKSRSLRVRVGSKDYISLSELGELIPLKSLKLNKPEPLIKFKFQSDAPENPLLTFKLKPDSKQTSLGTIKFQSDAPENPLATIKFQNNPVESPIFTLKVKPDSKENPLLTFKLKPDASENRLATIKFQNNNPEKSLVNIKIKEKDYISLRELKERTPVAKLSIRLNKDFEPYLKDFKAYKEQVKIPNVISFPNQKKNSGEGFNYQSVKQGDIDIIFPRLTVEQIRPKLVKFTEQLQKSGEDVFYKEDNTILFGSGEKFLEAKSGVNQNILGLGDEAPEGYLGFKTGTRTKRSFGQGSSIQIGEQLRNKGSGALIINAGGEGETLSFSGFDIIGKSTATNPRGLKDVAGFIQTGKGIAEIKSNKFNPLENFRARRGSQAVDEYFRSFNPEQRIDILNKLKDITGSDFKIELLDKRRLSNFNSGSKNSISEFSQVNAGVLNNRSSSSRSGSRSSGVLNVASILKSADVSKSGSVLNASNLSVFNSSYNPKSSSSLRSSYSSPPSASLFGYSSSITSRSSSPYSPSPRSPSPSVYTSKYSFGSGTNSPRSPLGGFINRNGFGSFSVDVRSKGKFVSVGEGLNLKDAIKLGKGLTGGSSARSFKIKTQAGKSLKGLNIGGDYYKKGDVYIEKSKVAINTGGELKQITFKGVATQKKKRLGVF